MGLLRDMVVGVFRSKARRGQMTSKRGNSRFYKGRGAKSTGVFTSKGYLVMKSKIPEIVVPDLEGFMLKPYVSYKSNRTTFTPVTKDNFINWMKRPWGQAKDAKFQMDLYLKRVAARDTSPTA